MRTKSQIESNNELVRSRQAALSGFTLIEILIVAGLIGLLAVIAVPSFVRSSNRAKSQICLNNLRQINGAVETWALEKNKTETAPVTWPDIAPYLKKPPICPLGGSTFDDSYTLTIASEKANCQRAGVGVPPATHVLP